MKAPAALSRSGKTLAAIRRLDPFFRTSDALKAGVHPKSLYRLRDTGQLEQLERGLYRLAELPSITQSDLVTVALKVPHGVICLLSALNYHELTTQIPRGVFCAVCRPAYQPRLTTPPVRFVCLSIESFNAGIEEHVLDGVKVRIYSVEKTLADCFKFRNQIGQDIAVEALRAYCTRRKLRINELMHFAGICRVDRVIRPYLEAIL